MSGQVIHGSSKLGGARGALALARAARYLWASPATVIGLGAAVLAVRTGGSTQVVNGVLEVSGGRFLRFLLERCTPLKGGASAMTLGHVIIARNRDLLNQTRAHERVHVRQCERWGPLFIPAYFAASLLAWARGQHPYLDNHFEREAYASEL
jgi:hypothetical protein